MDATTHALTNQPASRRQFLKKAAVAAVVAAAPAVEALPDDFGRPLTLEELQLANQLDLAALVHSARHVYAWYKHFEDEIEKMPNSARYRVYDSIVTLGGTARTIAMAIGEKLPPLESYDFTRSTKRPVEEARA